MSKVSHFQILYSEFCLLNSLFPLNLSGASSTFTSHETILRVPFSALTIFLITLAAFGQDSAPQSAAAEVAAKQSADERYDRMAADIQALQAANEALQQKLNVVMQQLQDLHSQLAQAPSNLATTDDLKRLAEKIVEVDRKREEDKGAISEEIRKSINDLKHALAESAPRLPALQTLTRYACRTC